ncbi:hypothetical protein [Aeromicrobium sp. PE09-221]|uniref:hypothetical protein n=1 Tax=Aeromicrobium sp. PE09-221 TaxID=1898043 RepID=UPI00112432B5|nr:hypothetical protein [Aeromicrobium sp. PE09-221]
MANVVKKSWRAAAALIGAAATVAAMSSPANASVQDINFEGNGIELTIVQAGQTISCPDFDLDGTYNDSTGIGLLDNIATSGCTNPISGVTRITSDGVWDLYVDPSPLSTNADAAIAEVTASFVWAGCTWNVAGDAIGTFDASDQQLEIHTSNLQISGNPSGFLCPILGIAIGQDIEIEGHWTNVGTPITFP